MSVENVNPESTTVVIPKEEDLNVQSGSRSWRFANGKIVQGQEKEAEVEIEGQIKKVPTGRYPQERASVFGVLRRIGIHKTDKGEFGPQHRIEADIETSDGMVYLGCGLLGADGEFKVGIAALTFTWCLLQYAKDELIRLEAVQGEPVTLPNGSKGGRPTYCNAYRIEGRNAMPIYRPKKDKSGPMPSMEESWLEMEPQIRAHPAYADRPVNEETQGGPTHLTELIKECEAKGIPSPSQAPDAWLTRIAERNQHPKKARLTDYDDTEVWGALRQAFQSVAEVPDWLQPFVKTGAAPKQETLI